MPTTSSIYIKYIPYCLIKTPGTNFDKELINLHTVIYIPFLVEK